MNKDMIYRQDAIDALYREIIKRRFFDEMYDGALDEFQTEEILRKLPSAQPEFIRCKKCKHWTRTCGNEQWGLGDCDVFDKHLVMCEGYCAWSERRENEEDS